MNIELLTFATGNLTENKENRAIPQKTDNQLFNRLITFDQLNLTNAETPKEERSVFDDLPAARNLTEAKMYLQARKENAVNRNSLGKLDDIPLKWGNGNGNFSNKADAKLAKGFDLEQINQQLTTGKPYSNPGTDFLPLRKGDYDFAMVNFTSLLYRHWDNPLLKPEARLNLTKRIINEEGNDHLNRRWLLGLIPETENHILMTESTRYLKNQIVHKHGLSYSTHNLKPEKYDNQKNGFNHWFVDHLSQFTRNDFDEYNSKPYQPYAVKAIQILFDHAEDPAVQKSARIVLDYISAKFALQSSQLRRAVPYRRRLGHEALQNLLEDGSSSRFAVLAGNYQAYQTGVEKKNPFSNYHMFTQGISKYEIPDTILDLMVDKGNNPYFMRSNHENTEIVYAEENFLISAGGRFDDWSRLPFSNHENGIVMPTVVMLKDGGPNTENMLKFLGRGDDSDQKNNTGVYENFVFGIRPVIPEKMLNEARAAGNLLENGQMKYLQTGNVYLAIFTASQSSPDNYAPSVGFAEIVDKSKFSSLAEFKATVEKNNPVRNYRYYGNNKYSTTTGKTIEFEMAEAPEKNFWGKKVAPDGNVTEWPVKRVWEGNRQIPLERDFSKWQLTSAESATEKETIMKADGTGQILLNNPALNKSLIMSLADHLNPIHEEQNGELIDLGKTADFKNTKSGNYQDLALELSSPAKVGYLSLKWEKDSEPREIKVYLRKKGSSSWELAEQRQAVFTSEQYDFRTDFFLKDKPEIEAVKFMISGKKLNLSGKPEIYLAY